MRKRISYIRVKRTWNGRSIETLDGRYLKRLWEWEKSPKLDVRPGVYRISVPRLAKNGRYSIRRDHADTVEPGALFLFQRRDNGTWERLDAAAMCRIGMTDLGLRSYRPFNIVPRKRRAP